METILLIKRGEIPINQMKGYKMQFETENEFINFLDGAKHNMRKDDLATRFLYHYRTEPEVYQMFEQFTLQLISKRPDRGSHWMIGNRMRWESTINSSTERYKITNDFLGLYARLFMSRHPQHNEYFQVKEMKRIIGL